MTYQMSDHTCGKTSSFFGQGPVNLLPHGGGGGGGRGGGSGVEGCLAKDGNS